MLHLEESVHGLWTLGIDVIGQEGGVNTRIGRQFLLVELLNDVQCSLCREAKLLVTVHLQGCQVVE